MKRVFASFMVVIAALAGYLYFSQAQPEGDIQGGVTIILIDEEGKEISNETYIFTEEMTIYEFLELHYEVGCADSDYKLSSECEVVSLNSRIIMKIDALETNWNNNYIQIFVNDIPAVYGVDQINLTDETVYQFEYTDLGGGN